MLLDSHKKNKERRTYANNVTKYEVVNATQIRDLTGELLVARDSSQKRFYLGDP